MHMPRCHRLIGSTECANENEQDDGRFDDAGSHLAERQNDARDVRFVSSIRLVSSPHSLRITGPSKQFQGICPARKNTRYGTPPAGTFMTDRTPKLPNSGTSVRMKIQETPRWVLE